MMGISSEQVHNNYESVLEHEKAVQKMAAIADN